MSIRIPSCFLWAFDHSCDYISSCYQHHKKMSDYPQIAFILFKCHRPIDSSFDKKAQDNKEFCHENLKPSCESGITTY